MKPYVHNVEEDGPYDDFLQELRDNYAFGLKADNYNREQGDEDMRALSVTGNWPEAEYNARAGTPDGTLPARPRGHYDICSQFPNRVVNQQRMNKRGVKATPTGEGASKTTAEKVEGRIREIEYSSKANSAYLNALQQAAERAEGGWRIDIDYTNPRSRAKKIVIKRVPNWKAIVYDPNTKESDKSDRKWLFAIQPMTQKEFKADPRFKGHRDPDEVIRSWPTSDVDGVASMQNWWNKDQLLIAEYWQVKIKPARVIFIEGMGDQGMFEDEIKEQGWKVDGDSVVHAETGTRKAIEDTRESDKRQVCSYFTNGFDVFSKEEWPGSWIPFPTVVGREKYEGDQLVKESITRKLREPQLAFDVVRANEQEALMRVSKADIVISQEAMGPYDNQWSMAHKIPQSRLLWVHRNPDGTENLPPMHWPQEPKTQALSAAAESYIRDAQNAVGMTTTERVDRVSKSGVAQQELNATADVASFHIVDNWTSAIEFGYRIIEELLRKVEDSKRTVGFIKADGSYKPEEIVPMSDGAGNVQHPYGPPDAHILTLAAGKDWQSQHQEDVDNVREMSKNPTFSVPLAPLLVKSMDGGPLMDQMAEVLTATLPPEIAKVYADMENGEQQLPPQAQLALKQLQSDNDKGKQIIQTLIQQLQEAQSAVESKQMELEQKGQTERDKIAANKEIEIMRANVDRLKIDADLQIARMNNAAKLAVAHEDLSHTENMAVAKNEHDEAMQNLGHEHEESMSEMGREHEKEMRDTEVEDIG